MIKKGNIDDLPIIGLTAYLNNSVEIKCIEAGMNCVCNECYM